MHATDVIAYTYDADYHCIDCTERQHPGSTDWRREDFDPADYEDSEGNEVHPLFASDEWWEPSEDACQVLACSDCHAIIDNVHREDCEDNGGDNPCDLSEEARA
jgi:hypothetical protein